MNFSSLRFKIFLGFGLISILLLVTGGVSLWGLSTVRQESAKVQQIDVVNATVLQMDRDVQELRMRVDRFVNSGHPSLQKEVRALQDRVTAGIATARSQVDDKSLEDEFDIIQSYVDSYARHFESVVVERQLRQELVYETLPSNYLATESAIKKLQVRSSEDLGDGANDVMLLSSLTELARSNEAFLRYFESPNTEYANVAVRQLDLAKASIAKVSGSDSEKEEIVASIDSLSKSGLRAVQATRSYLFLRNVLMAGDQSEVAYYSKALRLSTRKRGQQIASRSRELATRASWLATIATLAAIGMALLTALQLAMLILPPIEKLKDTFRSLSAGESLANIPGQDRKDEIGELAHAASVFSDKNQRTRELLAQSEQLSRALKARAAELTASNSELDQFAYVASHDLKSPLRGIRQLAGWIAEDARDHLPPESLSHLDKMQHRVTKMEEMLEDLLQYSRVGRVDMVHETVDIATMIRDIVDLLDNPQGVDVRLLTIFPTFETLATPLRQVFQNLIGNAIKHNDRGSKGLIDIDCVRDGSYLQFSITDNGPGIDPNNHERIFQMFQRVGTVNVDGSGMGLSVVRKQVQAVGGRIEVVSELGEGARFLFTWPAEINPPQSMEER